MNIIRASSYDNLEFKQRCTAPWKPREVVVMGKPPTLTLVNQSPTAVVNVFIMNKKNKALALELNRPRFALWPYQLASWKISFP